MTREATNSTITSGRSAIHVCHLKQPGIDGDSIQRRVFDRPDLEQVSHSCIVNFTPFGWCHSWGAWTSIRFPPTASLSGRSCIWDGSITYSNHFAASFLSDQKNLFSIFIIWDNSASHLFRIGSCTVAATVSKATGEIPIPLFRSGHGETARSITLNYHPLLCIHFSCPAFCFHCYDLVILVVPSPRYFVCFHRNTSFLRGDVVTNPSLYGWNVWQYSR